MLTSTQSLSPLLKTHKTEDLIEVPVTVVVNAFSEEAVTKFSEEMNKASRTGQTVIPVVIDSYGGHVYSLLAMMDIIKSSPIPIATIAIGKAMSCGAVLLSCGVEGHRYVAPNATVMVHDASKGAWGKVEEIKSDANELDRLNKLLYNTMARNCGKHDDYFLELIHNKGHADWFLTPTETQQHNIANHIRVPKLEITIDVSVKLT